MAIIGYACCRIEPEHIEVHVPEKLSHEERELYERLRALSSDKSRASGNHWWKRS